MSVSFDIVPQEEIICFSCPNTASSKVIDILQRMHFSFGCEGNLCQECLNRLENSSQFLICPICDSPLSKNNLLKPKKKNKKVTIVPVNNNIKQNRFSNTQIVLIILFILIILLLITFLVILFIMCQQHVSTT